METAQADAGGGTPPPECCPGAWMRRPAKALSTLHRRDTGPGRRSGPETPKPPQTRSLAIPVSPRPAEGAWSPRRWRGRPHQTSGWNAARYLTGEMGLFRDSSAWPSGSQRAGLEHSFSVGGKAAVSREPIRPRWDCKCAGFSLAGLLLGREKIFLPAAGGGSSCPWVGCGQWAPHSTRVVSLCPYWNVGLGALAQALGHTLGRAAVSAATLGKQQVPPLNLLWGGGWRPQSQVGGCSEHPAGPPDAPGTQPTLLLRAAASHRLLPPSIPATNTGGPPAQTVPGKMAGEGKWAL